MHDHGSCREPIRLTALATCVLAALGFTATGIAAPYEARMASPFEASGGVQVVTNCNDNGAGSLRAALALAGENDTVDLTALDCGTIALTTGQLESTKSVRLLGPGADMLAIDATGASRVLFHTGAVLEIEGLALENGYHDTAGGCLWAGGNLNVIQSRVSGCTAGTEDSLEAIGGAAAAGGNVHVESSYIANNRVVAQSKASGGGLYGGGAVAIRLGTVVTTNQATAGLLARGGGLYAAGDVDVSKQASVSFNVVRSFGARAHGGGVYGAFGDVRLEDAVVADNLAVNDTLNMGGAGGVGGGIVAAWGDVSLVNSRVSGNVAFVDCDGCDASGGGISAYGKVVAKYSAIHHNSVVTANANGQAHGGGIDAWGSDATRGVTLRNSTVSNNEVIGGSGIAGLGAGGAVHTFYSGVESLSSTIAFNRASHSGGGVAMANAGDLGGPTVLESSIVARNTAPEGGDIALSPYQSGVLEVAGNDNIVMAFGDDVIVPHDTIADDPLLLPLAANGGPTATHALAACSPAVDAGGNPAGSTSDQRLFPHGRDSGLAPDIGAFELHPEDLAPDPDRVFADGFEPAPCE